MPERAEAEREQGRALKDSVPYRYKANGINRATFVTNEVPKRMF